MGAGGRLGGTQDACPSTPHSHSQLAGEGNALRGISLKLTFLLINCSSDWRC